MAVLPTKTLGSVKSVGRILFQVFCWFGWNPRASCPYQDRALGLRSEMRLLLQGELDFFRANSGVKDGC